MVLAVVAPAAAGLKVIVDHDENYDFSKCKTYLWQPGTPAPNELSEERIFEGVDSALLDAGLVPAEGDQADLFVLTEVAGEQKMKSSNVSVGIGVSQRTRYGSVGVGTSTSGRAKQVTVGTLVIALLDGETGKLVWRANATDTVTDNPERTKSIIEKAIQKAFKKFPPQKK
jgi:hypothetical protein